VAIVAIGEDAYAETPGNIDDLTLSAAQLELARAIRETGTPMVLVLLHGRPRVVREAVEGARAVLTGYEAGPYAGEALASVIFGDVNPSGKLPFTWPRSTGSIMIAYDRARPAEIGGTDVVNIAFKPEWEFGHGLSYTTFAYSDLRVAERTIRSDGTLELSVTVANTGSRAGTEVVQLYVRDLVASVNPPIRRLRAFERVTLERNASTTVSFTLPATELSFVGRKNAPVLEPGEFDAMVGGLTARFELVSP
jgi:beta-glucosidase